MEDRCVLFYIWTKICFVDRWYHIVSFKTFRSCMRYAQRVLDKYSFLKPEFKFEKVVFFNGSVVEREFIA